MFFCFVLYSLKTEWYSADVHGRFPADEIDSLADSLIFHCIYSTVFCLSLSLSIHLVCNRICTINKTQAN